MQIKPSRHNRIREALDRIYDQHPPQIREYLRRYEEDPKSRVFAPLAEAYRRQGRVDEAMGLCLDGLEHHPDFHGGRVALAKCYIDKRYFDKAKEELERVVQNVPENLLAQKLLGEVFMSLGFPHQALHCFKMAAMLAPADVQLEEKVRQLEHSVLEGGSKAQGSSTATFVNTPVVSNAPLPPNDLKSLSPLWAVEETQNADTRDELSWVSEVVEVREEEPDSQSIEELLSVTDAEETFQVGNVSELFRAPSSPEITTTTLADLYFSQGQLEKSLRIYEKLAEKDPGSADLELKIRNCRNRMGITQEQDENARKIKLLKGVLERVRE